MLSSVCTRKCVCVWGGGSDDSNKSVLGGTWPDVVILPWGVGVIALCQAKGGTWPDTILLLRAGGGGCADCIWSAPGGT